VAVDPDDGHIPAVGQRLHARPLLRQHLHELAESEESDLVLYRLSRGGGGSTITTLLGLRLSLGRRLLAPISCGC
jgi:hypothetical protein